MATGDQGVTKSDMMARMRAVLPARWFPDDAPVLDSVLAGFGEAWAAIHAQHRYLVAQLRIATATGAMLDLIAGDFFRDALRRRSGEADDGLRARIRRELFRERGTRAAVVSVLTDLVGRAPTVFEPAYAFDTGGYGAMGPGGANGAAYGVAGGYGSLELPFQFFVTGLRGSRSPIASVMGYHTGSGWAGGGYDVGASPYVDLRQTEGQVTDADLFHAVDAVRPVGTRAWMALTETPPNTVPPGAVTGLVAA